MQKPDSNLPPAAQPWARWVESEANDSSTEIDELHRQLDRLAQGDGQQAGLLAGLHSGIDTLFTQLKFLYTATGNTYPPGSVTPAPPAPPAQNQDREIRADWSRTWGGSSFYTGGGTDTNGTYLYQGSNPENKVGMWHFSLGDALGKNILAAAMFLQNVNSPYQASFVASFGTHGNATAPSGKPGRQNGFDVGWGRGEGKWVNIPGWALPGLSNGSIQGFTVGASGASDPNYAYFMGVGQASPPVLKLTFAG